MKEIKKIQKAWSVFYLLSAACGLSLICYALLDAWEKFSVKPKPVFGFGMDMLMIALGLTAIIINIALFLFNIPPCLVRCSPIDVSKVVPDDYPA